MSPGCHRRSTDFRSGSGNTAGNVCRSKISETSESICRLWQDSRPFPVHRLSDGCVCECVIAMPFLSPAEPPVLGMFHPSQGCFPDAHSEQYRLFLMPSPSYTHYRSTHAVASPCWGWQEIRIPSGLKTGRR